MLQHFLLTPPDPIQSEYLRQALGWAREQSQGLEAHWDLFEQLWRVGKVGIAGSLQGQAEGIYNMLTGAILLSHERLPLSPRTCQWALQNGQHQLAISGRMDVLAVIVHETGHALAARQKGWWAAWGENFPYAQECRFLEQLSTLPAAQQRLADLRRDH
jgi:hypothetical protein